MYRTKSFGSSEKVLSIFVAVPKFSNETGNLHCVFRSQFCRTYSWTILGSEYLKFLSKYTEFATI